MYRYMYMYVYKDLKQKLNRYFDMMDVIENKVSYSSEVYLEPSRKSTMELFSKSL